MSDDRRSLVPSKLASDAERERTIELLRDAFTVGRLEEDELERRVQQAMNARTRDELRALRADLPHRPRRRAVIRAHRAALRMHATGYAVTNASAVGVWAATGSDAFFWPSLVLGPTTMLLAAHWSAVRRLTRGRRR